MHATTLDEPSAPLAPNAPTTTTEGVNVRIDWNEPNDSGSPI